MRFSVFPYIIPTGGKIYGPITSYGLTNKLHYPSKDVYNKGINAIQTVVEVPYSREKVHGLEQSQNYGNVQAALLSCQEY